MVQRKSFTDADCPVARSVDAIGDWWSLLIIRDAFDGSRRFGEFQRGLGISKGILAGRLRALVARGVLTNAPAAEGGAYDEYHLTDRGRRLFPVIVALRQWGEDHCFAPGEDHSTLVDAAGAPVGRLDVRSAAGQPLAPDETRVRKL